MATAHICVHLHVCVTLPVTLAGQRDCVQNGWQLKQVGRRSRPALISSSEEEQAVSFHFLGASSLFVCGTAPGPNWAYQSVSIPLAFSVFYPFFVSFNLWDPPPLSLLW